MDDAVSEDWPMGRGYDRVGMLSALSGLGEYVKN